MAVNSAAGSQRVDAAGDDVAQNAESFRAVTDQRIAAERTIGAREKTC